MTDAVSVPEERKRTSYLGPHEMRRLDLACLPVRRAFKVTPYLVGSVLTHRDYRDVDIRLMLPDDHPAFGLGDTHALNLMLSEYLRLSTGLPVDFQLQKQSEADIETSYRHPIGVRWLHP